MRGPANRSIDGRANECHQLIGTDEWKKSHRVLSPPVPLSSSPVALRDRRVFPVPGVARVGRAELARRRRRQRQRGHCLLLLGGVFVGIDVGRRRQRRRKSCWEEKRRNDSSGLWLRQAKAEGCRTRRDAERECWGRQRSGSRKEKRGGGKFCFFSLSSFLIRVEVAGDRLWSIFLHFFAIRSTLDCQSPRVRAKAFRGEHPFTTLNFLPFSFVLACARQRALDSERPCLAVRRVELWRNER